MTYYPALKKKEILPFVTTWMNLDDIMLSEISRTNTAWSRLLHVEFKIVKLVEAENRMVAPRGWGKTCGELFIWYKISASKTRQFQVSVIQHDAQSRQRYSVHLTMC